MSYNEVIIGTENPEDQDFMGESLAKLTIMSERIKIKFSANHIKETLPYKAEWIAALKSGQFAQGKECLCEDGKYCCLGLLSHLQKRLNNSGKSFRDGELFGASELILSSDNPVFAILQGRGDVPYTVLHVIYTHDLNYPRNIHYCFSLAGLNDAGASFEEIADVIDQIWD